jgi:DNA invertase Pin-like site-specific DNA recombinase
MLIGYMRVSKNNGSQTLDLQRDALIAAGVQENRIYQDSTSGKNEDRPGLQNCLKALQKGNTLVVWKLDRLGRDLKHLVTVIDDLRKRDIGFKVLAGQGAQIDTTTSNGRLVFGLFASIAEFERDLIVERTMAGLESARSRGHMGGRPRKMDAPKIRTAMAALSDRKSVATQVARTLGVTTATLYKHVNADGTLKAAGQKVLDVQNTN